MGGEAVRGAEGLFTEAAVPVMTGVIDKDEASEADGTRLFVPPPPLLPLGATEIDREGVEVRVLDLLTSAEAEALGVRLPVREPELDPEGLTEAPLEREYVGEVVADPKLVADADSSDDGDAVKSIVRVTEESGDCVAVGSPVGAGEAVRMDEADGEPLSREETDAESEGPPVLLCIPVLLAVAEKHSDAEAEEEGGAEAEPLPVVNAVLVDVAAALREEEGGTEGEMDGAADAELLLVAPEEKVPAPSPVPLIVRLNCGLTDTELLTAGEEDKDAEEEMERAAETLRGALTVATVALPVADKDKVAVGEAEGEREKEGEPVSVAEAEAEPSTPDEEGERVENEERDGDPDIFGELLTDGLPLGMPTVPVGEGVFAAAREREIGGVFDCNGDRVKEGLPLMDSVTAPVPVATLKLAAPVLEAQLVGETEVTLE